MKNSDIEQMKDYGITYKSKNIYSYKEHHYDKLKDALNYAEIDMKRRIEEKTISNEKITQQKS